MPTAGPAAICIDDYGDDEEEHDDEEDGVDDGDDDDYVADAGAW